MTLNTIFKLYALPFEEQEQDQVLILLKAWPDYLQAARYMAADEYECKPEDLTQPMIKKYLSHIHEYDATEISWIIREASKEQERFAL